ncbi:MAG: bis(5'-nucleosyl)-tetraphosphatase (symmetrical) YqeK [Spirochaetales bacterium]|nr:bis(5'-nucleosyl)-tetraphosphatase (symmetrical) YqeK [Spirochaetales bacterium]MCF7937991.1 bis(5'-nucleosyl)-tetraphosphatase (symmetrical) YqeK [Spirochaetales bacterium]
MNDYLRYLRKNLSFERYTHSLRTAELARVLAQENGVDPEDAYLAALLHDIARDLPVERLEELAGQDGKPFRDFEREKPVMLHGRAGAVLIEQLFGIEDKSILEAVRNHTTGSPGMDSLSKIVYVADTIEPGRKHISREDFTRYRKMSMNELLCRLLEESFAHLGSKGNAVAQPALDLYNELSRVTQ